MDKKIPQFAGPMYKPSVPLKKKVKKSPVRKVSPKAGPKAQSPVRKVSPKAGPRAKTVSPRLTIKHKLNLVFSHVEDRLHMKFTLTEDAVKLLQKYVAKLSKTSAEVPIDLLEGAQMNPGHNIFPKTTEYILTEILELSAHGVRDRGRSVIYVDDIQRVVANDHSLSFLLGKVKSPKVIPKQTFIITLNTYFTRTNDEVKEKNPSQTQLDKIVKKNVIPEVREWALNFPIKIGDLPIASYKNLKAHPKGKITFEVSDVSMDTISQLVKKMNENSFEDGFYEAMPGTGFVVATKRNSQEELGVIDYRGRIEVKVK